MARELVINLLAPHRLEHLKQDQLLLVVEVVSEKIGEFFISRYPDASVLVYLGGELTGDTTSKAVGFADNVRVETEVKQWCSGELCGIGHDNWTEAERLTLG